MGCLKRLGCLLLLAVLLVGAAWYTRAKWLPLLPSLPHRAPAAQAGDTSWHMLTLDGAGRARQALRQLAAPRGPDSVVVTPGDLASYIFQELSRSLPVSADSIRAAAIGDRLYISAVVRTADIGAGLGPLGALLGERERVTLGGTLRIIRLGQAELDVKEIKIGDLAVPGALIPKLIQQMAHGTRPAGIAPDGVPLRTPDYVGSVTVSNGLVTLYRARAAA